MSRSYSVEGESTARRSTRLQHHRMLFNHCFSHRIVCHLLCQIRFGRVRVRCMELACRLIHWELLVQRSGLKSLLLSKKRGDPKSASFFLLPDTTVRFWAGLRFVCNVYRVRTYIRNYGVQSILAIHYRIESSVILEGAYWTTSKLQFKETAQK